MRNIQTLWLDPRDQPQIHISNLAGYDPNAQVELEALSPVRIAAGDPAALVALARACDEAAVRLSAAIDARATAQVTASAGAA